MSTERRKEIARNWARKNRLKNPDRVRENNRLWVSKRRSKWLKDNGPCTECGSKKRLEVDHIDPDTKVHHSVWTWSEKRRGDELKKCQVLCFLCHRQKTNLERGWTLHGEVLYQKGCRCEKCVKTHKKKIRTAQIKRLEKSSVKQKP